MWRCWDRASYGGDRRVRIRFEVISEVVIVVGLDDSFSVQKGYFRLNFFFVTFPAWNVVYTSIVTLLCPLYFFVPLYCGGILFLLKGYCLRLFSFRGFGVFFLSFNTWCQVTLRSLKTLFLRLLFLLSSIIVLLKVYLTIAFFSLSIRYYFLRNLLYVSCEVSKLLSDVFCLLKVLDSCHKTSWTSLFLFLFCTFFLIVLKTLFTLWYFVSLYP